MIYYKYFVCCLFESKGYTLNVAFNTVKDSNLWLVDTIGVYLLLCNFIYSFFVRLSLSLLAVHKSHLQPVLDEAELPCVFVRGLEALILQYKWLKAILSKSVNNSTGLSVSNQAVLCSIDNSSEVSINAPH